MKEQREQSFLLGNEAIARGAIEANIGFAAAYPGTPSTEILQTLSGMAEKYNIYVEWSTNEMVALEGAFAASLAGLRAMVSMKHAGLNWVLDPLSVAVQGGIRAGLVIVTADDINAHSSANEQDNRFFGLFFRVLTLEPSDPQEAKDMTVEAFSLSEKTQLPVILRTVTRVGHARANVVLGKIRLKEKRACFKKEPERFYITGARALQGHSWQLGQQPLLEELVERLPFNKLDHARGRVCIVTSGVGYIYVKEALSLLNKEELAVLKIGSVYPLPKSSIKEALSGKDTVLVIEEGGPFVELQLKALVSDLFAPVRVFGKMSGHLSEVGELNVGIVVKAIAKLLGQDEPQVSWRQEVLQRAKDVLPPRTMTFCAGCPHNGTIYALKEVIRKRPEKPFIAGDIGCYTLMTYPPYELGDVKYSMGASLGVGSGMSKVLNEKVIAVIGDGTFFHAGVPGLINCVYNKSNITVIICDNRIVAMTGGQPHPGTGITVTGQSTKQVDLKELVKGCGVEFVEVTDPYDIKETKETIERALNYDGVSVVISIRECALEAIREARRLGEKELTYDVDRERCTLDEAPYCEAACPLHIDVRGYTSLIHEGKFDEALRLIREKLPFPGIMGRVCPRPCESKCKRGEVDEPIAIASLKRSAADYGQAEENLTIAGERKERIAIVGGGPAGLMAAYDLRKMGYQVTIFEALPLLGGMLSVGIPGYRLPRDILQREISVIPKLGIEVKFNVRVGTDIKLSDLRRNFNAIFIAIGAHRGRELGIENWDSKCEGLVDGVKFLHRVNLGERVEPKDKVVIVGGGNAAIDCARTCSRLGFNKVMILYRRSRTEMPARKEEVEDAEREGTIINFLVTPAKVLIEDGKVTGIECIRMELGEPDASGRRRPVPIKGSEFIIDTDMIIAAISEQPDLFFLQNSGLQSTKEGTIYANNVTLETNVPGIFAGGDAVTGPATVIDALAAGRKAAISIARYIKGEDLTLDREGEGVWESKLVMDIENIGKKKRYTMPALPINRRVRNFQEVELGFSREEAIKEAERGLFCKCGRCVEQFSCPAIIKENKTVIIDSLLCNGCGLCAQICPSKAIISQDFVPSRVVCAE